MTTCAQIANVFESKWGFHPVDKGVFKKLCKVRYFAHINRIQVSRQTRWARKEPQNQILWEPIYGVINGKKSRIGWKNIGPSLCPETCPVNLDLLWWDYGNARMPCKTPAEVKPTRLTEGTLDAMIEQCELWLKRVGR